MHTLEELQEKQALPLDLKVAMTKSRIRAWVNEYGLDGVYVSFSGGKDSTVLLDIARQMYPDIKAVFVSTGLEFPEIIQFVKSKENVDIIRPKMNFKEVIQKYGYPFISKEVSECVKGARIYLTSLLQSEDALTNKQTNSHLTSITMKECAELASILNDRMKNRKGGNNQRVAQMMGWLQRIG